MSASALAVVVGKKEIDFDTFAQEVDACAQWLTQCLKQDEQFIAICIKKKYWHWVVTLALLQIGRTSISLYGTKAIPQELSAKIQVWLSDNTLEVAERVVTPPFKAIRESAHTNTSPSAAQALQLKLSNSARRIILTSGTTGRPKTISLDARQLKARLEAASKQFGVDVNESTRLAALMGIDTIGGMLTTIVTWLKGGAVLFNTPWPDRESDHGANMEPNLISASPLRLQMMIEQTTDVWPNRDQRIIRVGGARLNPKIRDEALRLIGSRVQTTYGSTELGLVASCDAMLLDQHPGAAGYVYKNAKVQIVDREHRVLPNGQPGLIRCKTAGMATEYEFDSDSKAFQNEWFYSADIGLITDDGLLIITGRASDVINLGGIKLSATDLESALLKIDELQDVCVIGEDQSSPNLIVAAVHDNTLTLDALRTKVAQSLPVKTPFHLLALDALPRNAMGKLQRSLLAKTLTATLKEKNKN